MDHSILYQDNDSLKQQPCIWVVFGASGDLVKRKILPAFYVLFCDGKIHPESKIVGISRKELDFVQFTQQSLSVFSPRKPAIKDPFYTMLDHLALDMEDESTYEALAEKLNTLSKPLGHVQRLFYFSTPPDLFPVLITHLKKVSLLSPNGPYLPKVLIEKPFGKDYNSATELNKLCLAAASEEQIYRIDHYLGKQAVQQIPFLRANNGWLEQSLHKDSLEFVEITISESIGFEGRAGYYDKSGQLRDMLQNHLLQLLALSTMELPSKDTSVSEQKARVLRLLRPVEQDYAEKQLVRGQYKAGLINGQPVLGYTDEEGVPKDSQTETFIALKAYIDHERWHGVPFYLRSGKRLSKRVAEIVFHLKTNPGSIGKQPTKIRIQIQPEASISLSVHTQQMSSDEKSVEQTAVVPLFSKEVTAKDAYEYILLGAMVGNKSLFVSGGEILASWAFVDPIITMFTTNPTTVPLDYYPSGVESPKEASRLLETGHFFSLF